MLVHFKLVPKAASVHFKLILDVDEVQAPYVDDVHISDVQYVICGGRVV